MTSIKPPLEEIFGFFGVGSLMILGIFLILDGRTGFLSFIEIYANTNAWAILVAVPLLVVAYVFGIISCLGVSAFLEFFFPSELTPKLFREVSESGNEVLMQKYLDAERNCLLLHGCILAFLLLAIGSWSEVRMMGQFGFVGYVGLFGGLAVASMCPFLARRIQRQVSTFVHSVNVS